MARKHTHPCVYREQGCATQIDCSGEWERNHDGWPESVCSDYHLPNGRVLELICEACADSVCQQCGAVLRLRGHYDENCLRELSPEEAVTAMSQAFTRAMQARGNGR